MDEASMRARVQTARVGRLATVTREGRPHVVPCCFALDGDRIVSAVDRKPKSSLRLRRLENISANRAVSLLVDHYDDSNWDRLWWVRVDGSATIVSEGEVGAAAMAVLESKYPQYRDAHPPGPVIVIDALVWRGWP